MALFKPNFGSSANLPSKITAGWAYFCTDSGEFFIDYADADGTLRRKQINAAEAKKLIGYDVVQELIDSTIQIPTSKAVFDAIEASKIMHVGPDKPTDPNIKVWINTAEASVPVLPRMTTVTLRANAWIGNTEPYSQEVSIATVTASSKVDLQPSAQQIVDLQNAETSLMIDNHEGSLTCYAIGNKPTVDYNMQVLIQEVTLI